MTFRPGETVTRLLERCFKKGPRENEKKKRHAGTLLPTPVGEGEREIPRRCRYPHQTLPGPGARPASSPDLKDARTKGWESPKGRPRTSGPPNHHQGTVTTPKKMERRQGRMSESPRKFLRGNGPCSRPLAKGTVKWQKKRRRWFFNFTRHSGGRGTSCPLEEADLEKKGPDGEGELRGQVLNVNRPISPASGTCPLLKKKGGANEQTYRRSTRHQGGKSSRTGLKGRSCERGLHVQMSQVSQRGAFAWEKTPLFRNGNQGWRPRGGERGGRRG